MKEAGGWGLSLSKTRPPAESATRGPVAPQQALFLPAMRRPGWRELLGRFAGAEHSLDAHVELAFDDLDHRVEGAFAQVELVAHDTSRLFGEMASRVRQPARRSDPMNPIEAISVYLSRWVSGMTSSTTTKIMAPAAKLKA